MSIKQLISTETKINFVFIAIALGFLLFPNFTYAQTTYNCYYENGQCLLEDNCGVGFTARFAPCWQFHGDQEGCEIRQGSACALDANYGTNGLPCRVGGRCSPGHSCVQSLNVCTNGQLGSPCTRVDECNGELTCNGTRCAVDIVREEEKARQEAIQREAQDQICRQTGEQYAKCMACDPTSLWTSFGCIPTTSDNMVKSLVQLSLGVAGGFALLFIIFGAFSIATSVGDPQKLQSGQQMITSAIIGTLFIIFSIIILNIIGVQILAIPGF